MKGIIIIAESDIIKAGQEKHYLLAEMLGKEYGFGLIDMRKEKIPTGLDLVINFSNISPEVIGLDRKIKMITWLSDANVSRKGGVARVEERKRIMRALFERSDLILCGMVSFFKKEYPEFISKLVSFQNSFGPYDRYCSLSFNEHPKMKCLLIGASHLPIYPLRHYVKKHGKDKWIDKHVQPVANFKEKKIAPWAYMGDSFAKLLNSYFCCFTDSSIFECIIGKCFEIPAAGSLLITNKTEDLKSQGFISGKHYVAVTKETVLPQIYSCLRRPQRYEAIRKEGMKFVRKKHNIYVRFEQFKRIVKDMMG